MGLNRARSVEVVKVIHEFGVLDHVQASVVDFAIVQCHTALFCICLLSLGTCGHYPMRGHVVELEVHLALFPPDMFYTAEQDSWCLEAVVIQHLRKLP